MRIKFITLGCKTNQAESNKMAQELCNNGLQVTVGEADLYIINTCAVTGVAERKSRHEVSKITRNNPDAKIIIMGCASENDSTQFNSDNVIKTFGTDKNGIIKYVLETAGATALRIAQSTSESMDSDVHRTLHGVVAPVTRTKTYIKIQDGCDNFCTFCIVPHLRGRATSRPINDIIAEIKSISPHQIVLTGINLTAYKDGDKNLANLCVEVNELGIPFEISSLYVNIITRTFIEKLSNCKNFQPNFHLSLQSASNAILKKMNRHYTSEQFEDAVNRIRQAFPTSKISVDIIVGFPTETDDDFMQTYDFANKMKFDAIHIFPYSPRKGTIAASMKQLHSKIIKERADKLKELTVH
ncbi:MAG: MiaB/RimO family radical SAM methylthiotransferase [Firmicutes bacterium]|nr:MiaB/RimO family radical SAM methylthiotransferase [Bacillota bacterium]